MKESDSSSDNNSIHSIAHLKCVVAKDLAVAISIRKNEETIICAAPIAGTGM